MELSRVNRGTALTQPRELSKHSRIVQLLTVLGIRRQAKLDTEDYLVYATDLEKYDLLDLEIAMHLLSSRPRAEGETAFPELAMIEEAVRGVARSRKPSVPTSVDKWDDYLKQVKAERGE